MNINFSGKTDVRSKALEELCENKLAKVEKKLGTDNVSAEVNFAMEGKEFVINLQLSVDGDRVVAKSKGDDMYKNIDDAINKINSQLRKMKTSKKGAKKPSIEID